MKVLTKALIKESEENAVNSGTFSFRELMYTAGSSAAQIIMQKYDVQDKKIAVVCGKGNNGGDGCVIADILANNGADVTVVSPFGAPATENALFYFEKTNLKKQSDLPENQDIIIDALFGIGLDRMLDGKTVKLIEQINATESIKISVDIPSGIEADSGKIMGAAVESQLTVTFIALKPCFLLPSGSDFCGETVVTDIGVTPVDYCYITVEEPYFKKRRHNSHKGTYGTALMFCGSYGMAGAAILSAKGALRSGVGILKVVLCESIYAPFTVSVPEAVCVPVKQNESGTLSPINIDFENTLQSADAILVGCGLGNNEDTKKIVCTLIEKANVPIIIDADGINAIADCIDIISKNNAPIILTPHPGEMARLCSLSVKEIEENRVTTAKDFARKNSCILILKGANTIIADQNGEIFFNTTGNPGMATGGSGDVLAGIIVSLLAQGLKPLEAAKSAVFLHGKAGDKASEKRGERGMLPSDLIEEL